MRFVSSTKNVLHQRKRECGLYSLPFSQELVLGRTYLDPKVAANVHSLTMDVGSIGVVADTKTLAPGYFLIDASDVIKKN